LGRLRRLWGMSTSCMHVTDNGNSITQLATTHRQVLPGARGVTRPRADVDFDPMARQLEHDDEQEVAWAVEHDPDQDRAPIWGQIV